MSVCLSDGDCLVSCYEFKKKSSLAFICQSLISHGENTQVKQKSHVSSLLHVSNKFSPNLMNNRHKTFFVSLSFCRC